MTHFAADPNISSTRRIITMTESHLAQLHVSVYIQSVCHVLMHQSLYGTAPKPLYYISIQGSHTNLILYSLLWYTPTEFKAFFHVPVDYYQHALL